ncbi:MAG: SRPBCC domain-containing protein [Alphaproteobacteria bacterium]|nr:SRPBCC domain-containing protein [Alphaproteobacteria bacterium]MBU1516690.1 SRPBCC domain-containing protein [Alphaproteobacteria bacterium]MBU2094446.1 SRPBCC domain-containing protein [Alphaproteobacteria bacterium]MBU2152673.1 SRPBCC domain-containing protein [Alphaproteobacteria bacterium]MBU2306165.1 SRPBCC domain-containing protein [Alphaproteobacteria bacterium]
MNDVAANPGAQTPLTQAIVVEEVFPHAPEAIWRALTTGDLIARWLKMAIKGFAPAPGVAFTFQTTPAGAWDGVIHCRVLEAVPNQRLSYAWTGGHEGNVGYGAPLDTVVTWVLTPVEAGTRLRLVHAGFVLPRNETAFKGMSQGWKTVVKTIETIAAEHAVPKPH